MQYNLSNTIKCGHFTSYGTIQIACTVHAYVHSDIHAHSKYSNIECITVCFSCVGKSTDRVKELDKRHQPHLNLL